jgi:hypothetical protein
VSIHTSLELNRVATNAATTTVATTILRVVEDTAIIMMFLVVQQCFDASKLDYDEDGCWTSG